jgi:hypothetical protein
MAKYNVTCKCGHDQIFNICGPIRTRDDRAAWLASQDCPKCRYAAEQAAKVAEAAKVVAKPAATKSVILKAAWSQAKAAVKKFGGKAADYIAEAMRYAWGKAKEAVAAGLAIKAW